MAMFTSTPMSNQTGTRAGSTSMSSSFPAEQNIPLSQQQINQKILGMINQL
jgi:hypothetical protein